MNEVDAIVLDLDGGDMLQRCIDSLAAQTIRPSRVIILDNGSSDPVGRRLQRPPSLRVELVRVEANLGFAGGVNAAMRGNTIESIQLYSQAIDLAKKYKVVQR